MIWKKALKYPVLIVGLILFGLYITDPKTKEYWSDGHSRFIPNTCKVVKERAEKKTEDNWSYKCPGTQLLQITIESEVEGENPVLVRQAVYKELANSYVNLGRFSNPETIINLKHVEITIDHPLIKVLSKTDGQAVLEISRKKEMKEIAEHLRLTVKVKETKK